MSRRFVNGWFMREGGDRSRYAMSAWRAVDTIRGRKDHQTFLKLRAIEIGTERHVRNWRATQTVARGCIWKWPAKQVLKKRSLCFFGIANLPLASGQSSPRHATRGRVSRPEIHTDRRSTDGKTENRIRVAVSRPDPPHPETL